APFNDLAALERTLAELDGRVAAVIMEPMNVAAPAPGFLQGVKDRAHAAGALLIFDETITGFRFDTGGAQALFGVTPDLATFGKGIANGFPLSAVAGRRDVMMLMEEIFFSFTMGGETASLAAAKTVLTRLRDKPVLARMREIGADLADRLRAEIARAEAADILTVSGDPTWSFLVVADGPCATSWELKTLFSQEMFRRGVLTLGTHNLSAAHGPAEIDALIAVYAETLPLLKRAATEPGALGELLCVAPLQPLFKVR
ncbi:MAG: aminotransferase class III-fold pyridoxal phosphate-dependent enzyme, partial [Pseudomonadota bacterium]